MPHDPSTCELCCWLAEREGMQGTLSGGFLAFDSNGTAYASSPPCTSLDAVAGLWAEIIEATDNPEWWALERTKAGWGFYKLRCLGSKHEFMHEMTTAEYLAPPDLPGQPIIEAAMAVLGDKEKSDE